MRNSEWFSNEKVLQHYCDLLERYQMTNFIVDTAGRRDMLHMRITSLIAFVRYVSANHPSDIESLDDWFERIKKMESRSFAALVFLRTSKCRS